MIRRTSSRARSLVALALVISAGCEPVMGGPLPGDPDAGGSTPPRTIDEREPNDGPEVAQMQDIGGIAAGETILRGRLASGGNDGVQYTGDYDLFVFRVSAAGDLSITIDWTGDADVDAIVYDEAGTARAQDGTTARPITLRFAASAGLYGLQLYSKDLPADWTATFRLAGGGSTPPPTGGCTSPIPESFSGGCTLVQNEPAAGQQITLPFTFGWSASGCETPFRLFIYGNPPTEDNAVNFEISRLSGSGSTEFAGSRTITAADLASLRSDGIYHWAVSGFYGSNTAGRVFTVAPATCR